MNQLELIETMLRESKTIAVVGMSDKNTRASHHIGKYLADRGYHVLPVNPALTQIDGMVCYPDLATAQAAAKENGSNGIDLVDVFRASEHVPAIVKDVIRLDIRYLWLQDGVRHDEAIGWAEQAGVKCIQNDCIFRRHAQMRGD
jgi:predicted CoA-binding protein